MIRKNFYYSIYYRFYFFNSRENKEIRKSKLPWKQRNSIDKPKMIRASDESKTTKFRIKNAKKYFVSNSYF
jgi:hypothetical protein